jgi:PAS domain S-box-containing protein
MNFLYSPYILPLIAAALVSATVALYAWMRRSATGAFALLLMAVSIFIWLVGYSLEIAGTNLETKYFWGVIQYFGIAFAPYGWLLFALIYSEQEKIITRRFIILTALIPSITVLLALTTNWHGLIWSEYHINRQNDFSAIGASYGIWFFVHFVYSYLILLAGTVLLARALWSRQGLYRGQVAAMLVAVLTPWVGNALYLTGNSPIPYLDLTPFAFTVTVAALAWAILGFHLVDITPLARHLVVDAMREGMIVLDVRGIIVDINRAAARMIGVSVGNAIGKTAEEVFEPWSHLVEKFRNVTNARDMISVGMGAAQLHYEVRLSPLHDSQGKQAGRIIMLRQVDDDEVAQPAFYASGVSNTQPLPDLNSKEDAPVPQGKSKIWNALVGYYFAPIKKDIALPDDVNPTWYRTRERIFTIILRISATVGTLGFFWTAPIALWSTGAYLSFIIFLSLLWIFGSARHIKYEFRVISFLLVIYGFGFIEMLNFGFSVESFTFFISFVVLSSILASRYGALGALAVSLLTMTTFAVLIGSKFLTPLAKAFGDNIQPASIHSGVSSIMVFLAAMSAVVASVITLLENLKSAWQKEMQALNLLQQERDLLEQRVEDRTRDLADARDQALVFSKQMRKYYRALEQSGSTIVITDLQGNIEYVNPMFEKFTGYAPADVMGKNPRVLNSGEQTKEYYSDLWNTINTGNVWTGEFHNKRKDGSLYWESATIAPIVDQRGKITNYVAVKENITDRKRAEEQLQKLSLAVEQSGNTVIILDKAGLIEYVNPKFTEVTGYTPEEVLGKSPAMLYGENQERNPAQDEAWKVINKGEIWRGEFKNRRKNGSAFWESATIAPVHNRNGELINFVEIKQDITEQKILQDQLQSQNDYLSILHQMTLDLLNRRNLNDLLQVVVDRATILLDAPYCELLLLDGDELVVRAITENARKMRDDRTTRETAKATWQAVDTRQPFIVEDYSDWLHRREIYSDFELRATGAFPIIAGEQCLGVLGLGRDKPGYTFTPEQVETGILFARLVALVLDNASLYESAMREIEDRKHAEFLLQESEARFRQIVENASDIIYGTDIRGNFTYVNPAALRLLGHERESDLIGKSFFDFLMPESRKEVIQLYSNQYVNKIKNTYNEFYIIQADGQVVWLGQNVQSIMKDEEVISFQAVARDITQLKQVQESLAISRDQALEASRVKSQLLSRVSHELRTPLGGVLGFAELLQFNAFGALNEKQKSAVENIIASTNYLTNMVNDLLDEAQMESRSLLLNNAYFNPADMLEAARAPMAVLAERKGLTLTSEISPDLPSELYGDTKRLQQIIINLVGNAIKFTKTGEVRVTLERPAPARWAIMVSDTGVGIPSSEHASIFEPFRQVNNSITRENRGSGLGLAITKQLVELMGGQITIESEIGKGSLFTVTLPITNAPGE